MTFEQLDGAKDRLERVVELVGDAGHEQAHGRQAFLSDDLPLQRLEHLAHLALLLELTIERIPRVAEAERHVCEGVLHFCELEVGRQADGRRTIAVRDRRRFRSCLRSTNRRDSQNTSARSRAVDTVKMARLRR